MDLAPRVVFIVPECEGEEPSEVVAERFGDDWGGLPVGGDTVLADGVFMFLEPDDVVPEVVAELVAVSTNNVVLVEVVTRCYEVASEAVVVDIEHNGGKATDIDNVADVVTASIEFMGEFDGFSLVVEEGTGLERVDVGVFVQA